ncbi:RnfABCDGE type electron transport complex subunit G [Lutibacter sp.]|uniref:RnfABCDGE type electron transport complex subunit G n=1 Tax=Lutibacter sp. TaxID=1925666 RepID=UPI0025C63743|nr:RnfABCDGE type electron transport complex subunit G [Lutibacter sp.]MCF6181726.1 RnfABCDGE type electron transport complex subunit G [Lutibacter sp.]
MGKKKDTFFNMVISLLVITVVSGFLLGYVNDLTMAPKAKARLQKKVNALKIVLPKFDNNPVENVKRVKSEKVKDSIEIYTAYANKNKVGIAVTGSSEKGFNGLVKLMIGFKPNGDIQDIQILDQKETPGLGTKMTKEKFLKQFRGKNPSTYKLKVKKDGGDIDALTGATISSRAFAESVQIAYDEFVKTIDSI